MKFTPSPIHGAFIIDLEPHHDHRGFFARTFCVDEFAAHGIPFEPLQGGTSLSHQRGTVRGLHFKVEPHDEAKLIRCTKGTVFDVVADLRPDSPTFGRWAAVELSEKNYRMHYLPKGCAHGLQTLTDDSEVGYLLNARHLDAFTRGIHWLDPDLAIDWPIRDAITLSDRDANLPSFRSFFP